MHFRQPVVLYIRREKKMSKTLLLNYDKTEEDNLDKASKVLSKKEKEDLISDNNYNEDSINSQCIIDECSDLGENLIAITEDDPDNCIPYFVCDRHYHELMIGYYSKQKKNNNNALTIISQTH
jgi:hypothetical protein